MALQDISGVFSKFFVIGFFIPSFFAPLILLLLVGDAWLPSDYGEASKGTQILILGAAATLLGLLLSGLGRPLQRVYEGYFHKLIPPINRYMLNWWQHRFTRLEKLRDADNSSPQRTAAARRLDDEFPLSADRVMPTRLGNIMRASEAHARSRYNLNGVMIWPRIELMLTSDEHERLTNERTNVAFFLNMSFLILLTGSIYTAVLISRPGSSVIEVSSAIVITIVIAWLLYRAVCDAAMNYGYALRAAIDIHRLNLYKRLGVKQPVTIEEEKTLAQAINRSLRFGDPIPNQVRTTLDDKETNDE